MSMSVVYTTVNGMLLHENRGGTETDYVPDPLGSLVACKDSTGAVTYTASYWPYGEVQTATGSKANIWGFGGLAYQVEQSQTMLFWYGGSAAPGPVAQLQAPALPVSVMQAVSQWQWTGGAPCSLPGPVQQPCGSHCGQRRGEPFACCNTRYREIGVMSQVACCQRRCERAECVYEVIVGECIFAICLPATWTEYSAGESRMHRVCGRGGLCQPVGVPI